MDWIKIYARHLHGLKKLEKVTLIEIQLLTAFLERLPTESEMRRATSDHALTTLRRVLEGRSTTLRQVLDMVLSDVSTVLDKRSAGKRRKQKWREINKNKEAERGTGTERNEADKIREDKIRLDKTIRGHVPVPVPKNEKKKKAGSGLDFLVKTWKQKNMDFFNAYPKHLLRVQSEISSALANGKTAQDIEARIWATAGKNIPPWELFRKSKDKSHETLEQVDSMIKKYGGNI